MGSLDDERGLLSPSELGEQIAGSTLAPGTMLSHMYRIEKLLACGGMGEVYRAANVELGTKHAIKIMLPELANDQTVIDAFKREITVLRDVLSEAVVGYDGVVCDEDRRLYLIMEFVEGPSLKDRLKDGPLTPREVLLLRDRLAMGLGAAHEKGVIHRDMSPDNVILPGGRLENAKIIDFGIAKLTDPDVQTIIGSDFVGKYSNASPEQLGMFGGKVDARSDIYSVGLVLAAAAIGEPLPMGRSQVEVTEARRKVPDLSAVPKSLREQIDWMLQPYPADRPQSISELTGPTDASTIRPPSTEPGTQPSGGLRRGLIIGLATIFLIIAAGGGYYILRETIHERMASIIGRFQCAGLTTALSYGLEVEVTGFVSNDADLRGLISDLSAILGVRSVIEAVSVRSWPFCAAISVLETQAGLDPGRPGRPTIQTNNASLVHFDSDDLVIRASATQLFDGFLYIDFIDKQGSVYHLFPTTKRPDNAVFAGQQVIVGGGPGGYLDDDRLKIMPPFGTDMIVAVSTPVPLFADAQRANEPASSYLQILSGSLTALANQGHSPVASYTFITSRPRQ